MGDEQPGAPVDPTKPIQGPYGTGMSGPIVSGREPVLSLFGLTYSTHKTALLHIGAVWILPSW